MRKSPPPDGLACWSRNSTLSSPRSEEDASFANLDPRRRALAAALLVAPLAACVRSPSQAPLPPDPRAHDASRFAVRFAPGAGGVFYTHDALRTHLARIPPAAFTITLHADAIARYRTEPAPSDRLAWMLTPEGARWLREHVRRPGAQVTGSLASDLDSALFVVEMDGVRLFAGTTWPRVGAAAIAVPVMHPEDRPAPGVLLVGAIQGAWPLGGRGRVSIDRVELRRYFAARGVLEEVDRLTA